MEILTEEEVRHVASLAKIAVTEEEMQAYRKSLASLFHEVDKIKTIEGDDNDILIAPTTFETKPRMDEVKEMILFDDVKKNAPKTSGKYIEVPVMVHE